MIPILRKHLTQFVRLKFTDNRVPGILHQSCEISVFGKSLRITPFRFVQSKANNDGKPKSFEYTPGMSPAEFKNSGKQPKKPLYQRMAGERGQIGTCIGLGIFICGTAMLTMGSYTWNSNKVIAYFERPETKIPRKLYIEARMKDDKEVYYVRFDLMLLVEAVLSDLNINDRKKEDLFTYTADSLKTVGHGYMTTSWATMLGLPYFFEWNSLDQVDLNAVRHKCSYHVGNVFTDHILTLENLNLENHELNELKETFVLSDKAKKFAIAQKILEMESSYSWPFYTFVPMAGAWVLNIISCHSNDIFKMLDRPWFARYALYSVHTSIVLSFLAYLNCEFHNESEKWIDDKMALIGRDYLEGGKEFFTKETRRGILLRKGLGERGEKFFHENGELERMWYEPTVNSTPNSISSIRIKSFNQLLS